MPCAAFYNDGRVGTCALKLAHSVVPNLCLQYLTAVVQLAKLCREGLSGLLVLGHDKPHGDLGFAKPSRRIYARSQNKADGRCVYRLLQRARLLQKSRETGTRSVFELFKP